MFRSLFLLSGFIGSKSYLYPSSTDQKVTLMGHFDNVNNYCREIFYFMLDLA